MKTQVTTPGLVLVTIVTLINPIVLSNLESQRIGKTIVVGGTTRIGAKGLQMNATLIIDVPTVQHGTMGSLIVGKDCQKAKEVMENLLKLFHLVKVQQQKNEH